MKQGDYVIVATRTRNWSIVAGTLESHDKVNGVVHLLRSRMIAYFPRETHALFGLAARGALHGARVTPEVIESYTHVVEHVLPATAEARALIEAEPWG